MVETAPDLTALGAFLRERRRALGLTQQQLAERLGWQQERISTLENGRYGVPSIPLLAKLAEALEVSLAALLEAVGYPVHAAEPAASVNGSGVPGGMAGASVQQALYYTLQRLISIQALDLKDALNEASDIMAEAMGADKVDAFMYEPETATLVAMGTSNTPMGRKQWQVGLHRIPLANRGRTVEVYETGQLFYTGHAEQDPEVSVGQVEVLGIHTMLVIPLRVGDEIRGVLAAESTEPDRFGPDEREFFAAAGHWVGMIAQRTELNETINRRAIEEGRRLAAEELVTMVAHDVGNRITPIKGRIDLILRRARREGNERDADDAAEASQALARLQRLITDLLDVSRLEQGVFTLSSQLIDLVMIAREVVASVGAESHPIDLRLPEELVLQVDPARISQALQNLIGNATQHTPPGTPILVSLGTQRHYDGEWAIVDVHDEGPGIPGDLLPRLFHRHTAGSESEGLGLGLYLARGIAEAHGGTLTVESEVGSGTTFHLTLPCEGYSDGSSPA